MMRFFHRSMAERGVEKSRLRPFITTCLSFVIILEFLVLNSASFPTSSVALAQEESSTSSAQSFPTAPGCNTAFRTQLGMQESVLRQIWFGRKNAEEEQFNAVRDDEAGNLWIKTGTNDWRTSAKGFESVTWTNEQMNMQTLWEGMNETDPESYRTERLGIFEQKGMLTSEFIPALTQSFRAFQCRTEMVCEAVEQSFLRRKTDAGGFLHITTPGCDEFIIKPFTECRFGNADPKESVELRNTLAGFANTVVYTECRPLAAQLTDRNASFLRIAVAYDAAMRTILQFTGGFDAFLQGLRNDVLAPLEQTMSLLSQLSRIPCFSAQCNE